MRPTLRGMGLLLALLSMPCLARALERDPPALASNTEARPPAERSGREIYKRFREGLADTRCEPGVSSRWSQHFANAPRQMAARNDDVLPLFGYVVEALREANLPTEYALIPFVESGYEPGARSASGPAGLWQMIAITARNHGIQIRAGYDGRLSPVDSTQAAVRYLKTLHGMFAGDWRLAVMAYNAGEYRIFSALKRSGQRANAARPDALVGLSGITQAYVRKLHALSCLLDQADDRDEWLRSLDRPVPTLVAVTLPAATSSLDAWSRGQGVDAALVRRMNPAFPGGHVGQAARPSRILAPATTAKILSANGPVAGNLDTVDTAPASADGGDDRTVAPQQSSARSHVVSRGESAWLIARRYGLTSAQLLERNGLSTRSVLRPGMELSLADAGPP